MAIQPEVLLRGSLTYLQHARQFQRDAVNLYDNDSLSSAVVLSTIAVEHIATARWLYELPLQPDQIAKLTPKSLKQSLKDDHAETIRKGLKTSPLVMHSERVLELVSKMALVEADSEERKHLNAKIGQLLREETIAFPRHAHRLREETQYVAFDPRTGVWKGREPTKKQARFAVETAARNYVSMVHIFGRTHGAMRLIGRLGIVKDFFDLSHIWPQTPYSKTNSRASRPDDLK
jgi:AbiV family abortive infection protein